MAAMKHPTTREKVADSSDHETDFKLNSENLFKRQLPDSLQRYRSYCIIITLLGLIVRVIRISYPDQVVFDEVHFGKFASYYLERRFFFDIHPPLAKMYIAFIGYIIGYDGSFKFDYVGQPYVQNGEVLAPFVSYRLVNAILGTCIIPLVFESLKHLGCYASTCAFGALLFALDNAQVGQTRFIFLDTILLLSIMATLYSCIRFYKLQVVCTSSFTKEWYFWLVQTGFWLSCSMSCKYIGVMTYLSVGLLIIYNLYQLCMSRRCPSLRMFLRHFIQRLNYLVLLPFVVYLFWFWVHFKILKYGGDDNEFMSETFQDSLQFRSEYLGKIDQFQVNIYDNITIKHDVTSVFLGENSDIGLVVSANISSDVNAVWEVLPAFVDDNIDIGEELTLNEAVRLRNVESGKYLSYSNDENSHDYLMVADIPHTFDEYDYTVFQLLPVREIDAFHNVDTHRTVFKIFNEKAGAMIFVSSENSTTSVLNRESIRATRDPSEYCFAGNDWHVDTITNIDESRKQDIFDREVIDYPFFSKWSELQHAMFMYNNDLSSEHAFASHPSSWPLSLSGVLYWTNAEKRDQIYLIGNIITWWFQSFSLLAYALLILCDFVGVKLSNRLVPRYQEVVHGPLLFLFLAWGCHYFPFFLMERQKFLHHYLPAQMIACLFTALFWQTVICASEQNTQEETTEKCEETRGRLLWFYMFISVLVVSCFVFFAPLIYGWPILEPEQVRQREWFNIELNFT
ncbi:hypothetical protein DAKH74_012870 [Maudiozyma humilis]|uniref:Dolichyl-phosphate-mannose--protein mannosyltransferase n=1 Tax=Maudiozyma humilis TaxID=51915 RepID=A0AAV5RVJ8_MAUHU|nr:hypothetical protein DAKH74_012870 [Kazachstania humilis]